MTATATATLCQFDPDLRGLSVQQITVDGRPASWHRRGQELIIRPALRLHPGQRFTTVLSYDGVPSPVIDPDGAPDGWIPTADGAHVASEPKGSPSWYPCNDNPRDKAAFDVVATVPAGVTAMGNGGLVGHTSARGRSTFRWRMAQPMATYLATLTVGRFDLTRGRTRGGGPTIDAVDPRESAAQRVLATLPAIVDYYSSVFGRYPFDSVGAVVDHAHRVGYALETRAGRCSTGHPQRPPWPTNWPTGGSGTV